MRVVMGQENPMLGWHSPEHGKLVPAPVLVSRVGGESALFITVLEMPNARNVGKVDQETATTESRFQAITENHTVSISWPEGGKTQILTLDLATDKVTLK